MSEASRRPARDEILHALRAARPTPPSRASRLEPPGMPDSPLATLRDRVEAAGGRLECVARAKLLSELPWPIDPRDCAHVHSALGEIEGRGVGLEEAGPEELARLDLCVLAGEFAVVENGAAWHVPRSLQERRAALLAEHLVVVVEADALVPTLHQAYARIEPATSSFGWFLCGPSKTADIEQALVLGAHGARTMTLVLAGT